VHHLRQHRTANVRAGGPVAGCRGIGKRQNPELDGVAGIAALLRGCGLRSREAGDAEQDEHQETADAAARVVCMSTPAVAALPVEG
jgi:hypothetical protein